MTWWLPSRTPAVAALALVTLATTVTAERALGAWGDTASAGPMTLQSATLDSPTGAAAQAVCQKPSTFYVAISWNAAGSPAVTGYDVLRSGTPGGPYSSVGNVSGRSTTQFSDSTVAKTTTYYYVVRSTRGGWDSSISGEASVTTPNNGCH
jgi:beta-galactosidase